jgi:O-antigen/teichoic acid export membrane protein
MATVTVARQVVGVPLSLLSALALARLYQPADVGRFGFLAFLASIPAALGDLGISAAVVRSRYDPAPDLLAAASRFHVMLAIAALPPVLVATALIGATITGDVWLLVLLYVPTMMAGLALPANVLSARRLDLARVAWVDLGGQVAYAMLLLGFGLRHLGLTGLVSASALAQVARLCALCWLYPPILSRAAPFRTFWDAASAGVPLHFAGLIMTFHANLSSWLGSFLFGPTGVGYLKWSLDITSRVGVTITHAVGRVMFPAVALAQAQPERIGHLVGRGVRYSMLAAGLPLALMASLVDPAIGTIFGSRWQPAGSLVRLFAVQMVLAGLVVPLDAAIRVLRPTTFTLTVAAVYLAAEISGAVLLADTAGPGAIPAAHIIATSVLAAALWRGLHPETRPQAWSDVGVPAAVLVAAFAAGRALVPLLPPVASLVLGPIAGTLAAAVALRMLSPRCWTEAVTELRLLAAARGLR